MHTDPTPGPLSFCVPAGCQQDDLPCSRGSVRSGQSSRGLPESYQQLVGTRLWEAEQATAGRAAPCCHRCGRAWGSSGTAVRSFLTEASAFSSGRHTGGTSVIRPHPLPAGPQTASVSPQSCFPAPALLRDTIRLLPPQNPTSGSTECMERTPWQGRVAGRGWDMNDPSRRRCPQGAWVSPRD